MMDRLKSNKRKYLILGICVLLCMLGTGYYAWTLYNAHCKQVAEWNEGAKAAFEEALWMEVNKRAEIPIYYSYPGKQGMQTFNESPSDTVFVTSPFGHKGYYIAPIRYERSFIKDKDKNMILGALLYEYPLCLDSLAKHWDINLLNRKIPAQSQIRYVYTDWNLQNDTVYSASSGCLGLDSLSVSYLGFRYEHELAVFVSYPYRLLDLSWSVWGGLLLPLGLFVILFVCYTPLEGFIQRRFVKEKIVETEIHVADITIDKAKIYHLPDGSWFKVSECTLTKGELTHVLPPQSALLLKLFLRKENLYLSHVEIDVGLWNGKGTIDNIHKVIQRLRTELRKVSPNLVIKNVHGGYELKIAHFIE